MKVVHFQAENYQILKAIEITPEGNLVTIGGKNGQGKSSVLDAVWVALAGRAVASPMPIRKGEEQCRIRLDLGEIVITRTFTAKEGGTFTDTVKVESADGKQRFQKPQLMLNELLGHIGFDPFGFVQMKAEDQAETLLGMVALPIDLETLAAEDNSDFANRRDINRDAASLKGQIDAIPLDADLPAEPVDREAILGQLSSAADTNSAIERERLRRGELGRSIETMLRTAQQDRDRAAEIRAEIDRLEEAAKAKDRDADEMSKRSADAQTAFEKLPALDEPVDTQALRQQLSDAEATNAKIGRQQQRAALLARHAELLTKAEGFTTAMAERETARRKALAGAKMPIEGLGFAVNDKGKALVMFNEVPFAQASTADQIRASTAIAMSANPELRVLRIKDGSLLDEDSMAIITKMAAEEDFQLWIEVVGSAGVGIVIENGEIKGAAEATPDEEATPPAEKKPAAKKVAAKPEGSLL